MNAGRGELGRRIITAAVLVPLTIAMVVAAPPAWFATLMAGFVAGASWEWTRFARWRGAATSGYVLATLAMLPVAYVNMQAIAGAVWVAAMVWWLVAAAIVVRNECGRACPGNPPLLHAILGWLVLVPAWLAVAYLHLHAGPVAVLALLVLIWSADSAAYFIGRRWGRHRLAMRVSPGKSWEGAIAAVAAAAALAVLYAWWTGVEYAETMTFVILSVITVVVSIVGDLMESLFKRWAGLKDSGSLLPGHGGVLDRIDSLTAAAPAFALGVTCLEISL
jgi:phosphatidate cytidylyltransferase